MGRGRSGIKKREGGSISVENIEIDVLDPKNANVPGVREINNALNIVFNDYPDLKTLLNAGAQINTDDFQNSPSALGQFITDGTNAGIAINAMYATDPAKINAAMKICEDSGFHPPLGNATGYEAAMYHELGHAMTMLAMRKQGKTLSTQSDFENESRQIVMDSYFKSNIRKSSPAFQKSISDYALESFAETIAEAVCDHYCNGSKAKPESKAVYNYLDSILKS